MKSVTKAILEAVDDKERGNKKKGDEKKDEEPDGIVPTPPDDIDKVVTDEPREDPPFAPDANMTIKDDDEGEPGVDVEVPTDADDRGGVEAKVLDFIVGEGGPDDEAFHRFAGEMGMEPDDLEGVVYGILGSLSSGRSRTAGTRSEDVDAEELRKGVAVEREHTSSDLIAEMIAMDHLSEIPDYYTRLEKMESEARRTGGVPDVPAGGDDGSPRSPTDLPGPSEGRRDPHHSMDPHDGEGEDDGW